MVNLLLAAGGFALSAVSVFVFADNEVLLWLNGAFFVVLVRELEARW